MNQMTFNFLRKMKNPRTKTKFGVRRGKKIIFGVLAGVFFALFIFIIKSEFAYAESQSMTTQISNFGVVGYVILTIASGLLVFVASLVDFVVRLGNDILTLPAVITGWGIILNITNLGFVLAIIVIAFATIFRIENYALRQTLWKLIVAALLVNFSLVIAGGFISVSKIISDVFHEAALGNNGENLSNALANAMQPQGLGSVNDSSSATDKFMNYISNLGPEGLLKYVTSLLFIIIFTGLTILAFATLFVMLLVRAIALVFLLILSPLAWLFWIFPATQKYWHQWWTEFLRWNFFAPAVYFFIYLSVLTASKIQQKGGELSAVTGASGSESAASVFNKNSSTGNLFEHAANLFVVLGLLYGGIYLANKFGIAGGSIGVNMAKKIGKGAGGWAGKKTWGGIKNYTREGYNRFGEKMNWKNKSIEASQKGGFFNGVKARMYAGLAAPAERETARYKDRVSKLTMPQSVAQLSTSGLMTSGNRLALMEHITKNIDKMPPMMEKRMVEKPETKKVKKTIEEMKEFTNSDGTKFMVGTEKMKTVEITKLTGKTIREEEKVDVTSEWKEKHFGGEKIEKLYKDHGMNYGDVEKKVTGMSAKAADAHKSGNFNEFGKEMDKFISKLKKSDASSIGKIWGKDFFKSPYGDNLKIAKFIAKSIGQTNKKLVASLLPNMSGNEINNFSNIYNGENPGDSERIKNIFDRFESSEGWSPASSEFGGGGGGGGKEEKK